MKVKEKKEHTINQILVAMPVYLGFIMLGFSAAQQNTLIALFSLVLLVFARAEYNHLSLLERIEKIEGGE